MANPHPDTSGLKRGISPGRPKGAKDTHPRPPRSLTKRREMNEFWTQVFNGEDYQENALTRIQQGQAPHLENYWLGRLNGKPVEKHVGEFTHTHKVYKWMMTDSSQDQGQTQK